MLGDLNQEEIETFLKQQWFGHLGCHAEGQTYVVPISFVYKDGCFIGQTKLGRKIDMLRKNPLACLQVDSVQGIADWTSIIAWVEYQELQGTEAAESMGALIDMLAPKVEDLDSSRSPRDVTPGRHDGKPQMSVVYRLNVTEMTGRFEKST